MLPETVAALEAAGITTPFPIQAMTLPLALGGRDLIGQAKTGTGKTLAFGIPLLQRVVAPADAAYADTPAAGKPQALVIVPTRELCVQVTKDLQVAGKQRDVRVLAVYGGRAYEPQVQSLRTGVEVVVGTPGRLLDLAQQGHLDLGYVRTLVLDEADEMLDLGFLPDVEKLVASTPAGRQTMLFSATMPGPVATLARRYMTQPTHIHASDPDDVGRTVRNVRQFAYRAHAMDKVEVLARLLQAEGRGLTIVFCRTKRTAAQVADDLSDRGFAAAAIHGDLGQGAREQALRAFRNGKVDVLVATDVAARGIDVENVTHVVNYQCPEDESIYLHRIGRTARAGAKGVAVTFVDWDDMVRWSVINKDLDLGIPQPEETYSTSAHLFTDLGIQAGTIGRLPRAQRTREGLDAEVLEDLGETGRSGGRGRPSRTTRAGGRPGTERSGRPERSGGSGATEGAEHGDATERPSTPRRQRERRRTRSGVPLAADGSVPVGDPSVGDVPAAASAAAGGDHDSPGNAGGAGTAGAPRRRRRRSRSSAPAGDAAATE